jgi:hypothetical protein
MNSASSSGADLIQETDAPLGLDQLEPEKFFGVWQHPEGRFTHFGVGSPEHGTSWILLCHSKEVAEIYIGFDAIENERSPADYEARRLSLPDAFDELRNLPLPIVYSTGQVYGKVGGVAMFDISGTRFAITGLFPL